MIERKSDMTTTLRRAATTLAAALAAGTVAAGGVAAASDGDTSSAHASDSDQASSADEVALNLTPSSAQLAACMPRARVDIEVSLETDRVGFDSFEVRASGLPPETAFTVFLIEQAGAPFGAAEYIGDITSDRKGRAENEFRLIVQEAFASTLVDGVRVRVDLNQVGMWFADPAGDDFCLGPNSPVTPFDGDDEAGVQAFNSANTTPLPAP
jgi:hypothetical protein